jgi:lysozyme family protein
MNFESAVNKLLGLEGGFSDHPADNGGKTMYGITEAEARRVGYRGDMRELPLDLAKQIYKRDYWDVVKADELPAAVRYVVFDAAVNSGTGQSAKWLQRACGVVDDGVIGPKTVAAANALNGDALRGKLLAQRLRFMANLSDWPAFGRGWARRICDLMEA